MSETNGVCSGFIADGYTREAFLKAAPGLYGEARFTYRPMLRWESMQMWEREGKYPDRAKERAMVQATAIMGHVKEWSLEKEATPAAYMQLVPGLATRLAEIVMGVAADDSPPPEDKADWQKEIEAQLAGEPVELIEAGN